MKHFFENLKNNIDFFLRQRLAFSRKNYSEANEYKEGLFQDETLEREKFLTDKYDLDYLKSNSTRQNYLENLYLIDILDKYLAPYCPPPEFLELVPRSEILSSPSRGEVISPNLSTIHPFALSTIDIGCKNWFYAKGEYFFFKKYCKNLKLDGIEIDANRLYTNFYSRKEVAKFYTKGLENVNYIEGDFLNHNAEYAYMIWILPFVVEEPLLKWGLPLKYFRPEEMLRKAYDSLKNDGSMVILNQGKAEHEAQIKLCEKLNISYTTFGEVKSEFLHYNIERHLMIIKK